MIRGSPVYPPPPDETDIDESHPSPCEKDKLTAARLSAVFVERQTARQLIEFGQSFLRPFIGLTKASLISHDRMTSDELIDIVHRDRRSIQEFEIMAVIDRVIRIVGLQRWSIPCRLFFEYRVAKRLEKIPYVFSQFRCCFT